MMYLAITEGGSPLSVHRFFNDAIRALGAIDPNRWPCDAAYCHGRPANRITDLDGNLRGWVMYVEVDPDNSVGKLGAW